MFKDMRATIEIRLDKPIEELWNNLDKDARWGVNKARKSELKIKIADNDLDWEEFYEMYKETIIRGGIVPKDKQHLKSETSKLFLCLKEDKIIAGAAIKIKEDKIELFLNASIRDFLNLQPNNLLYWSMIEWGKKNKYKVFDLGGYQINVKPGDKLYEINRFKERWGGETKEYYVYSKNPLYILGRKIIRNIHFVKRFRDKSKLFLYNLKENKFFGYGKRFFEKFIYDKKEILIYSIDLNKIQNSESKLNLEIKKANEELIKRLKEDGYPITRRFKDRFVSGDECFLIVIDGKTAHYSWVAYKEMDILEVGLKLPLKEKEACIFDCYTDKEFRGKGVYTFMLCKINDYLVNKNFKKSYIYADLENENSIKGIKKAGFLEERTVKYKNFLGFKKRKIEEIKILRSNS